MKDDVSMAELGPKTRKELKEYIREDTDRGKPFSWKTFFSRYFFEAGHKYIVWMRLTRYFYLRGGVMSKLPYAFCRFILKHYGYKYSFDISYHAQIGKGLYIAHYGYIVVPSGTVMGDYCRLRPGVIIGGSLTHEGAGAVIGDRVEFGVGCKVIGVEKVGTGAFIGANAVVTKNVPEHAIVAGIPARVLRIQE